jgi:hypothetical protein
MPFHSDIDQREEHMNKIILPALAILLLAQSPAHAINDKYRKQLEKSGCTQVSESQGCDIRKTKAENAKAGFTNPAAPAAGEKTKAPSTDTKEGAAPPVTK